MRGLIVSFSKKMRLNKVVEENRRGQLKIQQMAFVLVALLIFFTIVSLIFFKFKVSDIQSGAIDTRDEEAKEIVRKLSGSPELIFTSGNSCDGCVDLDKALLLSEREIYKNFWNLDYLEIETLFPIREGECSRQNYPYCKSIKIIDNDTPGAVFGSFVSICRWEQFEGDGYFKCEIGRILASGGGIG